jgi:hypothetical protein
MTLGRKNQSLPGWSATKKVQIFNGLAGRPRHFGNAPRDDCLRQKRPPYIVVEQVGKGGEINRFMAANSL